MNQVDSVKADSMRAKTIKDNNTTKQYDFYDLAHYILHHHKKPNTLHKRSGITIVPNIAFNPTIGQQIVIKAVAGKRLGNDSTEATFAIFDERLQFIKQMVSEAEAGFVAGMLDFVRLTDPTATDWMPFRNDNKKRKQLLLSLCSDEASHQITKGYVFMAHVAVAKNGHDKIYTAEQINDITNAVVQKFPEPIALFKTVIEYLTNSDFPLDEASRANFLWDTALMFGTGKHMITMISYTS